MKSIKLYLKAVKVSFKIRVLFDFVPNTLTTKLALLSPVQIKCVLILLFHFMDNPPPFLFPCNFYTKSESLSCLTFLLLAR